MKPQGASTVQNGGGGGGEEVLVTLVCDSCGQLSLLCKKLSLILLLLHIVTIVVVSDVNVYLQLWQQTNINKMPRDSKDKCHSWHQIRIRRRSF